MSEQFEIPAEWQWSILYECFISLDNKAYTREGAILRGFADPRNRDKINKKGRPKTDRNRTKLQEAQLEIDDFATIAVDMLSKVAQNKYKELGFDKPVPVTAMVKAANILLDKAVSQEKEKQSVVPEQEEIEVGEVEDKIKKPKTIGDVVSFKAATKE